MSIQVNSINEYAVQELVKKCPKDVQDYVKALKSAIEGSQGTTAKAIAKIKEQSKEINKLKDDNEWLSKGNAEWRDLYLSAEKDIKLRNSYLNKPIEDAD